MYSPLGSTPWELGCFISVFVVLNPTTHLGSAKLMQVDGQEAMERFSRVHGIKAPETSFFVTPLQLFTIIVPEMAPLTIDRTNCQHG